MTTTTLPCPDEQCPVVLFTLALLPEPVCPVCGTDGQTDGPLEWAVLASHPRQSDPLLLPQPNANSAATTAAQINGDSSEASAEILSRPWVGWGAS